MRIFAMFPVYVLTLLLLNATALPAGAAVEHGDQYIGSDACMACHPDVSDRYQSNRHAVAADPRTPAAGLGCETCHGPGGAHAESEGQQPMRSFTPASDGSPDAENAICLKCHARGRQALWEGSPHQMRNLSCTSCHRIHAGHAHSLARPSEVDTCVQCHKDMRAQLLRQSRHPLREGKMQCTDCHNPHGAAGDKMIDAQSVNQKCFECHAQLRGPFLWEHPPATEDCLTCHTPHGSAHADLLKARAPLLCQRCHANAAHQPDTSPQQC